MLRHSNSWSRWGMNPTFREGPHTGSPSNSRLPPESRSSPANADSRVDFPQPEGPTMLQNSPSCTSKETSRSASTSPSGDWYTKAACRICIIISVLPCHWALRPDRRMSLRPYPMPPVRGGSQEKYRSAGGFSGGDGLPTWGQREGLTEILRFL